HRAEALVKEAASEKNRRLEAVRKRRPELEAAGDQEAASEIKKLAGDFDARRRKQLEGVKSDLDERRADLGRRFEENRAAAFDYLLKVLTAKPEK
ncbi:MAG TPA: hypothetical protein PKN80_08395, partial [bacterium]|nr:hypothetical protein [bacterium]